MAVNKVIYNNNGTPSVLIDLTGDTATASDVAQGKTFHLADGTQAIGTSQGGPTKTLLWTNPDLTENFGEKSIDVDVSSYDYIEILATMNGTGTYSYIFKVSEITPTKYNDGTGIPQTFGYMTQTSASSTPYNNSRAIYNASNLSFTYCYERADTTLQNHCKPYQVYGIKI